MTDPKPRKLVTLSQDTARRVDDFRFGQRIGSESEALRRLIEAGLMHFGQSPKQETRTENRPD